MSRPASADCNNTGMVAAYRAAEATILRAEANGLAIVVLANRWDVAETSVSVVAAAHSALVPA